MRVFFYPQLNNRFFPSHCDPLIINLCTTSSLLINIYCDINLYLHFVKDQTDTFNLLFLELLVLMVCVTLASILSTAENGASSQRRESCQKLALCSRTAVCLKIISELIITDHRLRYCSNESSGVGTIRWAGSALRRGAMLHLFHVSNVVFAPW